MSYIQQLQNETQISEEKKSFFYEETILLLFNIIIYLTNYLCISFPLFENISCVPTIIVINLKCLFFFVCFVYNANCKIETYTTEPYILTNSIRTIFG